MGLLAFVFPGQGAQYVGMGFDLYSQSETAHEILNQAEGLMPGLLDLCFNQPSPRLTKTNIAQPAIFAVSYAAAAAAREAGLQPRASAGFSLGEWTAIADAGMLPFEAAFRLVQQRGRLMQACAEGQPGGMAAILRKSAEEVTALIQGYEGIHAVNFNAPDQVVVAGAHSALDRFLADMKTRGVRAMKLNVAGAFHSPYMAEAGRALETQLKHARFQEPAIPVYSNLNAQPYRREQAADTLARQVTSSVLWVDSIRNMADAGCDTFLELGPGKVLSGLIQKILPEARVLQAEDLAGIQAAARMIGEHA